MFKPDAVLQTFKFLGNVAFFLLKKLNLILLQKTRRVCYFYIVLTVGKCELATSGSKDHNLVL